MSFRHIYFDADKSAQYFIVGETMPTIYYKGGGLFGPFDFPVYYQSSVTPQKWSKLK